MNASTQFNLNILIVEDNLSFALELEMLLDELNYNVLARVDNSAEALEVIFSHHPDLILMDIDIKGKLSGIEIGQKIAHLHIPILYITSLKGEVHYQAAQASNIIGYLVKPIETYTLRSSVQLAIEKAHAMQLESHSSEPVSAESDTGFMTKDCLFFKKKGTYFKVKIAEIAFIKSDDNYCETYTLDSKSFTSRITLSKVEAMLPCTDFMKVHRQYIVHTKHIDAIDFNDSVLKINNREVPISRSNRKELEKRIKRLE